MTKAEYQQIVMSSPAFQKMDDELKQSVLEAEEEEMEAYIVFFENEKKQTAEDKKQVLRTMLEGVRLVRNTAQKEQKTVIKKQESKAKLEERRVEESLLKQISNL